MRKLSLLLPILFAGFIAQAAFAADKAGDPCPGPNHTSQIGSEVMSCVDGKWKVTSHVGTTQVMLSVRITEGDRSLYSWDVTTLDGQPVPASVGQDRSYIAQATKEGDKVVITAGKVRDGLFMIMTPTVNKDGSISVDFVVNQSEVNAINRMKQGDLEIELPQVTSAELKQKVMLAKGKEIEVPFGPLVDIRKPGDSARAKYTLTLLATTK